MEVTDSWRRVLPQAVQDRYDVVETRNAAAVLSSTNPEQFRDVCEVLDEFALTDDDILVAGGNETRIAGRLNRAFRQRDWREERAVATIRNFMQARGGSPAAPTMDRSAQRPFRRTSTTSSTT